MRAEVGGRYRNFKTGNEYIVLALGKHSETLEDVVIYEAQYDNDMSKVWVRPRAMFEEDVEWPKDSGTLVPRFIRI